jgi:outer membrane autotransporter protein
VGIDTSFGILVPQASVAWVHEFLNDDRNIDARLVEAPAGPSFTFQREPPARDWANIGLGVSALLSNGLQPFVQVATMQGNENFVSYGGTIGLRKEF